MARRSCLFYKNISLLSTLVCAGGWLKASPSYNCRFTNYLFVRSITTARIHTKSEGNEFLSLLNKHLDNGTVYLKSFTFSRNMLPDAKSEFRTLAELSSKVKKKIREVKQVTHRRK